MEDLLPGVIALFFILILFLVFRECVCWYFKINEIVAIKKNILFEMQDINKKLISISNQLNLEKSN